MVHPLDPIMIPATEILADVSNYLVRKLGMAGTSEDPRFFDAEDTIPLWILASLQPYALCTFTCDVETFWEDGWQNVYPLHHPQKIMINVENKSPSFKRVWICGSPTRFHYHPRPRNTRRSSKGVNLNDNKLVPAM